MIIECPACHTRYDIKAVIPPEGRTVRCAKCTNVWRATPQMRETENASETDTADSPATAANQAGTQPEMQSASKADEEKADEESKESGFALHRFGNGSSGHPASQETEPAESQTEIAAPPASLLAAQDTAADEGNERFGLGEADNGKIRWFSSFRRKAKQDPPRLQQGNDEAPGIAAGQTIPFRLNADGEATGELNTLEDARQAVRGVFAGLGDVRPQAHGRLFTQPSAVQASQRDGESQAEVSEPFSFTSPFNDATGFTETEASQDSFEEQTRTAMQSHFTGPPTEDELTQELETHFRSNATAALDNGEGTESLNAFWNRARVPVKELLDEPSASEDEAGTGKDDAAFDERLYREIEHRQEQFGETRGGERRGGLALLAGWGLFLCTASGLLIGLFAFRDITADALPGLAPFYRAIGMPVTVQPLIFEGVQYRWTVSENKPAIVISGSVYNRAQRKVRVPQFFINVKDADPALDREYSASLNTGSSKIKAGDHVDFEIELMAPSPTVTAVELELRNVR